MARILTHLTANLAAYQDRWSAFEDLLDDIETALRQLPNDSFWPIIGRSGLQLGVVTSEDFLAKFGNFSWSLVQRDFTGVNGGVGQVVSRFEHGEWVSAAEEINAADFETYMHWPERRGATYLALHEVAHTSDLGIRTNIMAYDRFIHGGGQPDQYSRSSDWWYNERIANRIALTIADAIQFPILNNPTGGYNLDVFLRQMEIA